MIDLRLGDCLEVMKTLPDNSVDAIVTDPPYGLSFMGKKWDYDVPSQEIWEEVLRVLKPGGYLLSFAGTRTQHRMAVRIEDAGFEIRDMIFWTYASGFPKSLNLFKQYKKRCECGNMEAYDKDRNVQRIPNEQEAEHRMRPVSESDISQEVNAKKEQGEILQSVVSEQDTHHEGSETLAMLQLSKGGEQSSVEGWTNLQKTEGQLQGSDVSKMSEGISSDGEKRRVRNAAQTSDGTTSGKATNENGSSTSYRPQPEQQQDREPCAFCKQYGTQAMGAYGLGSALKPACEPITVARKPISEKNLADNFLKWGTGGIDIDGSRVESNEDMSNIKAFGSMPENKSDEKGFLRPWMHDKQSILDKQNAAIDKMKSLGRFPANLIHDGSDEVVGLFPNNSARFFKTCSPALENDKMSVCNHTFANNVELGLITIRATIGNTAPLNVEDWLDERLVQNVKSVGIACQRCATSIAQELAKIRSLVFKNEGLLLTQDFIGNFKNSTPILNLASIVEVWESIDTTPTTQNLSQLFGSVLLAIDENTSLGKRERVGGDGEPKRLGYFPKASKAERNRGCEGMEKRQKVFNGQSDNPSLEKKDLEERFTTKPSQNFHPTVKPIALMEYLVKLVSREGATVLDPFMGSGTTGIACKLLKRNFIGIELDQSYFEIAKNRINATKERML